MARGALDHFPRDRAPALLGEHWNTGSASIAGLGFVGCVRNGVEVETIAIVKAAITGKVCTGSISEIIEEQASRNEGA